MKRAITILTLIMSTSLLPCSCVTQEKDNNQQQEEQAKDLLVGTKWSTRHVGNTLRYLEFYEGGRARISFSDRSKTYDGTYILTNSDITFTIGFELLGYENGIVHSFNYTYKTGTINGNKINAKGVIISDTATNGQEFSDIYTKEEQ